MRGSRKDFDDSGVRFREEDRGFDEFMRQLRAMFSQDDKEESNLDKLLRYAGVNPDDQTMDPNDLFERYLPEKAEVPVSTRKEDAERNRIKEIARRVEAEELAKRIPLVKAPKEPVKTRVAPEDRPVIPNRTQSGVSKGLRGDQGALDFQIVSPREPRKFPEGSTMPDRRIPENLDPYARPPILEEAGFVKALKATPLDETNRTMSAGDEDIDFDFNANQREMAKSLGYKVDQSEDMDESAGDIRGEERYRYYGKPGSFLGDLSRAIELKYDTRPELAFGMDHESGEGYSENKEGGLIPKRRKKNKMRFAKGGGAIGCGIAVRGNRNLNRDITKKTNI